ncbi:hypothetical protein Q5741_02020 [Paenibacillus sp. JX-17]|uniref:Uncharacterized protein n=1 Tax=Paenibacillus lacisoli TaxID=3064525 RepID=A0ABT9C7H9_9BACL|nr:hypothetical protein [Paenibacillus sp. JX-17]MDO7905190.1 hypothetical protein [Paenibacillus sp. JX-17]
MSILQERFAAIMAGVRQTLEETASMTHPLVVLFRTALEDEQAALVRLLSRLKEERTPPLSEIKNDISIIYLNDEVVESTFRAWLRAVQWMDHADSCEAIQLENRFPEIKQLLRKAAEELKQLYGASAIKFVVPALYQPQA